MAGQPDAPEGQTRFLRESGKNARMQRQYFNRAGEPMYSSLLMALMDRAGLNPMSLLHPQKNSQPRVGAAPPTGGGLEASAGGGLVNSPVSQPHGSPTMGLNAASPPMSQPSLNSPTPGIGQGQPGVMGGSAAPGGQPHGSPTMGQMGTPPMAKLAGAFGGGGGPQLGGGNRLHGGGQTRNPGGGSPWPTDPNAIYQNPNASALPDPNNIGNSQGWNDQDKMMWQSGVSNINNQFDNLNNRAAFQTGQNLGPGQNSISAGLQSQLARDQGQAMTGLANQVTMQGIQTQDARLNQLMQALGPLMGFPAQASQSALGTAQGYGSMPQQQGGLGGLGALAYLFA